ncbi:FAD-dependent monooxygenase [Streptomyces sp. AN-3]|uniref:NAD(P)/FAD-dependent oxidoreductase n=1 Tax=Streptomyces sp. AN-3 TaxID=3044177 RepID=UPI00249BA959|nr:FAD-dependent monooxygenase [Streptomyces sp. AN-3]MDI3101997.1 FAD-dependent monooxygenase [Streptomyces sp. AN-3]
MSTDSTASRKRPAIVIGGGLTGMLAARVLSDYTDVIVIERDVLPEQPEPRKGLPQASHTHMLWSGGADAIESLLPGTAKELDAAGAHRIPLTTGMVAYSAKGWYRRWDESHYAIACSRDLLDWVVRGQVLKHAGSRITVMEDTTVLGLTGTADAVTGVSIRRAADDQEDTLLADLVVDASGKGSRAPNWLEDLGAPQPATREVDSGLVYASRVVQAPPGLPDNWPIINVQPDPRAGVPGQTGVILPIEGGRWLVTLSGTRGGQPTSDPEHFQRFALGLRHPIVGELLSRTKPLGPVQVSRMTANRRRFYEKTAMPENLLVLGDAVAAYNPTYGHGMSVAAQGAVALGETIRRRGWRSPGLTARAQKAITKPVATAWAFATGTDVFYEGATETGPTLGERVAARFVDRLNLTATGSGRVARALTDVMTLQAGPEALAHPSTLIAAAVGPLKPQLTQPPLTAEERQALDYTT